MSAETARSLAVVAPVGVAGGAGLVAGLVSLAIDPPSWGAGAGLAALLAAAIVAEAFPLPIEGVSAGQTSLAIVPIVASAVLYGWDAAAVVGFLTMALVELGRRRPMTRVVFNPGLYVLAAIAAGLAAGLVGGGSLWSVVAEACLGAAGFYAVNMLLLSAVIARTRWMNWFALLGQYVYSTTPPFLVIVSLIITLIVLWNRSPWISVVVIGPLITVALHERWLHHALEQLREFDRLKDEFIAVISHELRTPLTSVYGAAVTLQEREVDEELRRGLLAIVSEEAGRLGRLLDDVLSASRLHAGQETFHIVRMDGVQVTRGVVEGIRQRLPEGTELELVAANDVPFVAADPDKVRQILVNLLENSIKYSPDGGRIEVRVADAAAAVRFSVRDQGIGIAEEQQATIFERFYRLDPNMTRGVGGTGLGLYICRELVQIMGGRIWVQSQEGAGSTFTFELPTTDEASLAE